MNSKPKTASLAKDMLGTWRLVSRVDRAADGALRSEPMLGADPLAMLTYTPHHFSAQFMKRDRNSAAPAHPCGSGQNNTSAIGGYDAYFGTYQVCDGGVVLHRLEAALTPANVGMEVARTLAVDGDTLTITLETTSHEHEPVTRTLTWTRLA
ncbi:MAG TPA: lipocalin-like domain-containing protein [Alphaproteobacteria bacterium]|nr:lipocalin-like domain-containing protein [Alphaproteobacteria bacterium]